MSEGATRYPLSWPFGWARTRRLDRKRAAFARVLKAYDHEQRREVSAGTKPLSVFDATRRLQGELERLGATDEILSTNVQTRLDGLPRSDKEPEDPGAAVYFTLKGKPLCFACDRWTRVADNIAAIAQHIDALRRIDRYGVGSLDQAFAGYAALPQSVVEQSWRAVLGYEPSAMPKPEEIEDRFRQLARQHHPDVGGEHDMMSALSIARHNGLAEMNPEGGP